MPGQGTARCTRHGRQGSRDTQATSATHAQVRPMHQTHRCSAATHATTCTTNATATAQHTKAPGTMCDPQGSAPHHTTAARGGLWERGSRAPVQATKQAGSRWVTAPSKHAATWGTEDAHAGPTTKKRGGWSLGPKRAVAGPGADDRARAKHGAAAATTNDTGATRGKQASRGRGSEHVASSPEHVASGPEHAPTNSSHPTTPKHAGLTQDGAHGWQVATTRRDA